MASGAALAACDTSGGGASSTRPAARPRSMPPASDKHNILFVFTDQERYFDKWPSGMSLPGRERLQSDGVSFHKHYGPAVMCTSSRSVMLTGLQTPDTKMFDNVDMSASFGQGGYGLYILGSDSLITNITASDRARGGYVSGARPTVSAFYANRNTDIGLWFNAVTGSLTASDLHLTNSLTALQLDTVAEAETSAVALQAKLRELNTTGAPAEVAGEFDARTDKHLLRISRRHHGNVKSSVLTQDFVHGADYAALAEAANTFRGLLGEGARVMRGEGERQKEAKVNDFREAMAWLITQAEGATAELVRDVAGKGCARAGKECESGDQGQDAAAGHALDSTNKRDCCKARIGPSGQVSRSTQRKQDTPLRGGLVRLT